MFLQLCFSVVCVIISCIILGAPVVKTTLTLFFTLFFIFAVAYLIGDAVNPLHFNTYQF